MVAIALVYCLPMASGFGLGLILNCPQRYQESNNWCWAGTSQSVLSYYGAFITQSNIAAFGTGGLNTWNYTWGDGTDSGDHIYRRGVSLILSNFAAIASSFSTNAVSGYPDLRNEIVTNRRPVVIHWTWDGDGGHILAIHGIVVTNRSGEFKQGYTNVWVMDPWYGPTVGSYDWVCHGNTNAEGWHTWDYSLVLSTPAPTPVVSPPLPDFGVVEVGTTVTQMCAVENDGGGWAVGTISVASPFAVVLGSPYDVHSYSAAAVFISYSPTAPGTNTATVLFTNTILFQLGESPGTTCTAHGIGSLFLEQALDVPYLTVASGPTPSGPFWKRDLITTHDGTDAAKSGAVSTGGQSWCSTTVTGPGAVSFWWKVSSGTNGLLDFSVSGAQQGVISNNVDWVQRAAIVPVGSQTLKWTYSRPSGAAQGQDAGWVDQVTYAPAVMVGWGDNGAGQLNVPAGLTNLVELAGSWQGSFALNSGLTMTGWGSAYTNYGAPPAGLTMTNVVAIAVPIAEEGSHVLALQAAGQVVAWGSNISYGQTNVPAGLTNAVAVAAGSRHSLALKWDGTVAAWGDNIFHQTNVPPNLTNVVAIAAGQYHNLALNRNGTVTAWGYNVYHQTNVPAGLSNAVAVAAGAQHSMTLKADGTVLVWGNNIDGETNVPPGLSNVVAIAAGGYHCLALKSDGNVVAWGDNDNGQTNMPTWLTNVVAIAAGATHSLALMSGEGPAGTLCLTNLALHTNRFTCCVPTARGRSYFLEYKGSLADSAWMMRPPLPGDGTIRQLADPSATTAQRFYRVRQQ
jgi:hypothetical protein